MKYQFEPSETLDSQTRVEPGKDFTLKKKSPTRCPFSPLHVSFFCNRKRMKRLGDGSNGLQQLSTNKSYLISQ